MSVLLDLASTYLCWGRIFDWQRTLKIAQIEFDKAQYKLSKERHKSVSLLLSKHFEENGQIFKANECYLNLFHEFEKSISMTTAENFKVTSQILRMQSVFDLQNFSLIEIYNSLATHNQKISHNDCDFEVQHALLTYEIKHVSADIAKNRLDRILSNPIADSFEGQWILEEFVINCLLNNYRKLAETYLNKMNSSKRSIKFRFVENIINQNEFTDSCYFDAVSELTPRQLGTLLQIDQNFEASKSQIYYQNLFIAGLSNEDKNIWTPLFKNRKKPSLTQQLRLDKNSLSCEGEKSVLLTDSYLEIIHIFKTESKIEIDTVLKILWDSQGHESDLSRLRMRITRLNKMMLDKLALPKFIELSKESLTLNYKIIFG